MPQRFAEVIIDLLSNAVDRPFHYAIPDRLQGRLEEGMRVIVPLRGRRCRAYVLRLLTTTPVESLREIIAIEDPEPSLNREQLALVHWLAMRCYCRKTDVIHAMIPASFRRERRPVTPQVFEAAAAAQGAALGRAPAQGEALEILKREGPLPRELLRERGVKAATLRALEKKGLIHQRSAFLPGSGTPETPAPTKPLVMRGEQAACFARISAALDEGRPRRILLHGITASGKTEIYLQGISRCLAAGRSALVLVPEIALTPQMIEHFSGRFPGKVAVFHSRLSPAEKNRHWRSILAGEAVVVLGARSAVFAPLASLGLIVIDEEHETTYKQDEAPRYHARDVAWWRARRHRAVLLLGSATPSLESYRQALEGDSMLLRMSGRVTPSALPPVRVVDMRLELKENHRHIFSRPLLAALKGVLERDEQALLFINRRGFSGFVLCRECGYVVRCSSCDVSMTLHAASAAMRCHYCSREEAAPSSCPACGGIKIRYFSAGTQRVEDEVKKLYPGTPLIRMDSDTTTGREAHEQYYRHFRERRANILIGTQMVAKGLDFPHVTLVGVIAADVALNIPDFRASERTFQLLTQVAGRTARGVQGGEVIVQSYHPSHYSILAAANHDYAAFSEAELENRRRLGYPPYSDMLRFLFSAEEEQKTLEAAAWFSDLLFPLAGRVEILGPAPASLYRIKDRYRVQIIVKGERLSSLAPAVKKIVRCYHERKPPFTVRLAVDFNPLVVL